MVPFLEMPCLFQIINYFLTLPTSAVIDMKLAVDA
jgi:hypothetical protein